MKRQNWLTLSLQNKPVCLGLCFKVRGSSDFLFIPLSSGDRRMMKLANPGAPSLSCEEFSWGIITRPLFYNIWKNYLTVSISSPLSLAYEPIHCGLQPHRSKDIAPTKVTNGFRVLSLASIFNPSSFFLSATFSAVNHSVLNYSVSSFRCLWHDTLLISPPSSLLLCFLWGSLFSTGLLTHKACQGLVGSKSFLI